jgi:hypothetical protein
MPLILEATPSFAVLWADLKDENADDEGRLYYLDAAAVARHLVDLLERGVGNEVAATLAVVERLHVQGSGYVRELATIGYLEDLQNWAARSSTVQPEDFVPLLGPESRRWWRGLNALWSGEVPPPVRPLD